MFRTDARMSGAFYRGELWDVRGETWTLIYVTPKQYNTVEEACAAAQRYITEFRQTGRTVVKVA